MGKVIFNFDDIEVKKSKFNKFKYPVDINEVDNDKIIISYKVSAGEKGFKYFIGYKDDEKVRPLCIMLSKLSGYVK